MSALEISRVLSVYYKTAWFMMHRIRHAMAPALAQQEQPQEKLSSVVEADETYIGGQAHGKRGHGAANKTPVVTLVKRDGEARSQVVTNMMDETVKESLTQQTEPEETVFVSDRCQVYNKPSKEFVEHHTVDHGKKDYVRWDGELRVHTNTAEGYFSQLKRSLDGTYHHVSERHLPRYLVEFDYRFNTRKVKDGERTVTTIRQVVGKRLVYQESTGG